MRSVLMAGIVAALTASAAYAQAPADLKPETTTFFGDTGLWFVPTADVLASGRWSASGYRRGTNYVQGFSNVGDFAGTVGYGIRDRAEIFGSFLFDTRVDRDLRPIFTTDSAVGGVIDRYPRVSKGWSGDNVGDFYVGAKVALVPNTLALRGIFKVPTGDDESGVSTGKPDVLFDVIASREMSRRVTVSGYGGYEWRGKPDGIETPGGAFRWGGGAGFPSRSPLRAQLELNGTVPSSDTTTLTGGPIIASDGSIAPLTSEVKSLTRATAGVTWQASNGVFIGGGMSWNVPRKNRELYRTDADNFGDFVDWQVRIGFHPGSRSSSASPSASSNAGNAGREADSRPAAAPATPPAPSAPAPAPSVAAPPAPAAPPAAAAPPASTQRQEGSAAQPPVAEYAFDDVYLDFDRYSLRPDAAKVLDGVVAAMQRNTTLRLEVEGHTCDIGTAEYNLALGDRRAQSVKNYLVAHGVPAARLTTISYGEERPKYDNLREETRRMNRRAALVISLR